MSSNDINPAALRDGPALVSSRKSRPPLAPRITRSKPSHNRKHPPPKEMDTYTFAPYTARPCISFLWKRARGLLDTPSPPHKTHSCKFPGGRSFLRMSCSPGTILLQGAIDCLMQATFYYGQAFYKLVDDCLQGAIFTIFLPRTIAGLNQRTVFRTIFITVFMSTTRPRREKILIEVPRTSRGGKTSTFKAMRG